MAKGQFTIKQERFVPYFLVILSFWLVCIVESIQKMGGQSLDPRFWMFLSILITLYGGFSVFRLHPTRRNNSPDDPGVAINQVLDAVRAKGMVAYHEGGGEGPNADCVAVGPSGIYVIETKARNVFGSGTIDYRNSDELILGGKISDNQPLKHARAGAQTIRQQLGESYQQYPIKPLVVFSGDWRVNQPATDPDVAVIAAYQLGDYLDRQKPQLTKKEIDQICSQLEQSVSPAPA